MPRKIAKKSVSQASIDRLIRRHKGKNAVECDCLKSCLNPKNGLYSQVQAAKALQKRGAPEAVPAMIEVALASGDKLRISCEAAGAAAGVGRTPGNTVVIHLPASVRV